MAYLDGGMIYSHDNGTSIRTNISINDCLPGHLDSALMKVFYTDISDPFNPVNDSILFPLDSVRVNDRYLLKSSDIVRFAGAVRVDKITLDIPRHFISYIDSTTYNVNRGQSLLFYYNWHWGLFKAIENPISVNYDINYALESVSIDGEGRILQHRSGDSVSYSYDYYLKDHLGSTRMVINDQNSITEKVAYQSYGTINPLDSSSPALPSREKFTGKEFDTQGADFARVEFDIAVTDYDMSTGSGFIRVTYNDVATGNNFSKIYKTRYDSRERSLRFTGSESFTGEVEIEQMFLMASGAPGGIFNIVPIDSFLVSPGKTRKVQLNVASSEIMGAPADSSFYSMHAAVDNSSYFSGTRLFYFGSRYYDPELGIWLSVDPASQFANAYGYSSNPLLMVDKDGNFFWLIPVAIGAAVGAVQGYSMGKAKGAEGGSMFGYIFGGAIIGGISGYATAGVGNAVTGAVGTGLAGWSGAGFTAATVGGAAGSAVGGAISGFGTGLMSGASGGQIWEQMWKGAAFGGLSGGASSALCYGLSSSFRWETHKKVLKWANNHDAMDKAVKYSAGIQAGGKVDIKNSFYYKENSLKTPVGEGVAGSGQVSENAKPFIAVAKNGVIDNSGNFDPSRLWESVSHEVYESVKGHTHNQIYGGIMQANQYYKFWSKDTKDIISELKELYLQIEPW